MTPQLISSTFALMSCSLYHQLQHLQPTLDLYQGFSIQSHVEGIIARLSWKESPFDPNTFNMMLEISNDHSVDGTNPLSNDLCVRISSFTIDDNDQFHLTLIENKTNFTNIALQLISEKNQNIGRIMLDNCCQFSHNIFNCNDLILGMTLVAKRAITSS